MWKPVCGIIFMLLLLGALVSAFNFGLVQAQTPETVYINSDGSISPSSAPIATLDNVTYLLTGNIAYPTYVGVVVGKNNIVIDGNGHTVQGMYNKDFARMICSLIVPTIGIDVSGTVNVTVENTTITDFDDGISIGNYSHIDGNNITNNSDKGILIGSPYAPRNGVSFFTSGFYSSIDGNNITDNGYGALFFYFTGSNSINGNNITASTVYVDGPANGNSVSGNTFVDCGLTGEVDAISVANNTVNGKPLVYLRDEKNYTVSNAGQVILIGCDNITMENLNLSNADIGMWLDGISNSTISQNNLSYDGSGGIDVLSSSSTSICGNNITEVDGDGIFLGSSSNDSVCGNNVANDYCGIYLDGSSNNSIVGNNITRNGYAGILVGSSSNNSIYHNNFINNTVQALDSSSEVWNDGYPSGGNYWSDYQTKYPNATEIDGSGIWNMSYVIDANNTDNYPLMTPAVMPEFPSLLILTLFMMATLLPVIIYQRKALKIKRLESS